nr:class I tRNA ligase family protein [Runella salmonicolor]
MIEELKSKYPSFEFYVQRLPINHITNNTVNVESLISKNPFRFKSSIFVVKNGWWYAGGGQPKFSNSILEPAKFLTYSEVEKMSKSKLNVVNPDDIIEKYGADTLRMYEMFLGPLTDAKPWNMNGISGTFNFLRKFWRLFFEDQSGKQKWTDAEPTAEELKVLHRTIKRVEEDIERLSFNTVVSTFMIAVNDLSDLKCHKKAILQDMLILLAPYAPHITEELWVALGNEAGTISAASFPVFNPKYLEESAFEYPIQINGKVRANIPFPVDMSKEDIEQGVLANETVQKWLEGKAPKKVVVVPKRIVNVVL